jgi:hypothetical protein
MFATLVPFEGRPDDYYSPEKNKVRQEVNEWIRTAKDIDGICDLIMRLRILLGRTA